MKYEEAVEYLLQIPKFSKKTSKENLLELLNRLGNPQEQMKTIHVAGTNGKGSVCAFLESVLRQDNRQIGMFTSPHLISMNERFVVDGKPVDNEIFLDGFIEVKKVMDEMVKEGKPHVSFFEMLFVMGALIFSKCKVEYGIFETGLGGRLDATNVLNPKLCIITSIGMDHMQQLGNTIESIAKEKAGIIKEGVPVVFYDSDPITRGIMEEKVMEKATKFLMITNEDFKIIKKSGKYIDFCMCNRYDKYGTLTLCTFAQYQAENAALVIAGIHILFPDMEIETIRQGLLNMQWPGRMEEIEKGVYLDGAHNEAAVVKWIDTVRSLDDCPRKILLFAAVLDKDITGMVRKIMENISFEEVIITKVEGGRGVDPKTTLALFRECGQQQSIRVIDRIEDAYREALQIKGEDGLLFCLGSLYLAGSLKSIVNNMNKCS